MHDQWLLQQLLDRHRWIERRIRILEHHLHAPAQRPQLAAAERGQVGAGKRDLSRCWLDQTQDREPGCRLAAAGLANQTERFAGADLEGNAVDGVQAARGDRRLSNRCRR